MDNENEDAKSIKVKGVGDSLWVTFNPLLSEGRLKEEIGNRFKQLKHFVVNASVVLDPGVKDGYDSLVEELGRFLKTTFKIGDVTRKSQKSVQQSMPVERIRQRDVDKSWQQHGNNALMLAGRIRSGQKITAKKNLIIMGNVNPGAQLLAGGDIIVMGDLKGTAFAGYPDNMNSIIVALKFNPTQVQIGNLVAAGLSEIISNSSDTGTEYAHIVDNTIVVEDYLKTAPFGKEPWPKQR